MRSYTGVQSGARIGGKHKHPVGTAGVVLHGEGRAHQAGTQRGQRSYGVLGALKFLKSASVWQKQVMLLCPRSSWKWLRQEAASEEPVVTGKGLVGSHLANR